MLAHLKKSRQISDTANGEESRNELATRILTTLPAALLDVNQNAVRHLGVEKGCIEVKGAEIETSGGRDDGAQLYGGRTRHRGVHVPPSIFA